MKDPVVLSDKDEVHGCGKKSAVLITVACRSLLIQVSLTHCALSQSAFLFRSVIIFEFLDGHFFQSQIYMYLYNLFILCICDMIIYNTRQYTPLLN